MALFTCRQCWVPTLRGTVVLGVMALAAGVAAVRFVSPFLAVNEPVAANVLVVESWLPDYAMQGAAELFKRGGYRYIITSGRVLNDRWLAAHYTTAAEFAAANLALAGVGTNRLVAAPPPPVGRDRTYNSACAVQRWLAQNDPSVTALNVYSLGPHARRTRLLFQKAMGSRIKVGIIAAPAVAYDPEHWWANMQGFDYVIGESLAYCYARCIFPFVSK